MTRPQEFSPMARPGQVLIKFTAGPPGPGQATPILSLLDQQGAMVQLAVIDKGPCGPPKKEGGNPVKAGSAPRCCARKDLDYSRGWLDRKMAQKPGRRLLARRPVGVGHVDLSAYLAGLAVVQIDQEQPSGRRAVDVR